MMKRKYLIVLIILILLVLLILLVYYIFISINYVPKIYSIEECNIVDNETTNDSPEILNITP